MMAESSVPSAAPLSGGDNRTVWSVSELAAAVRQRLESGFAQIRVRGELGRVSQPGSGHLYLDIKEGQAVLAGVIWRPNAARLGLRPETGMEVICSGRLSSYAAQSRYQLVIEHMELAGQGALMAMLEARRRKLAAEGLFDAARKQALPFLPERIGVITSPTGAVIRDIAQRIGARFARPILLWPVRVQGESCPSEVARAIAGFNALEGARRPDVLIVARGGGSLEDLWGFNEEEVVRAAAASRIPLISAIGHESDIVLLDYAADMRAATPSAAAERVVPVRAELLHQTDSLALRLRQAVRRFVAHRRTALAGLARALVSPQDMLLARAQRLDELAARARQALQQYVQLVQARLTAVAARAPLSLLQARLKQAQARLDVRTRFLERAGAHALRVRAQRLGAAARALSLVSYESVLQRGFALVFAPDARLVRRARDAPRGTRLRLQLAAGEELAARSEGEARAAVRKKSVPPPPNGVNSAQRKAAQSDLFAPTGTEAGRKKGGET